MNKTSNLKSTMIILFLIVLFSLSYISLIFNNNIWSDEAFTIKLVSPNSISDIISGTADDVHPPLYYLIAKIFVKIFGSSIQVYKIVSVIPMVLTMLLSITYIKKWFGGRVSVLFILFINAIPCVLEYAVQIRMYSWTIFFLTLAVLSAYGVFQYNENKYYITLFISALCSCYLHNFAMISAFLIYIATGISIIIKRKRFPIKWLIYGVAISVSYMPWLFVLYKQTTNRVNNYWIAPVTPDIVLGYFNDIFGSRIPYSTIMFIIICIFAMVISIRKKSIFSVLLMLVPTLTAAIGIAVSVLVTPFFIARYIVPCMGILALYLAISYSLENNSTYVLLCLFLFFMFGNSYYTNYITEYKSTYTQELLNYMDTNLGENDVIMYNYEIYGYIYECYFDSDKLVYLDDMDFSSDYDTVWFLDNGVDYGISDNTLYEFNLTKEYIASLGIEQNNFILYKISRSKEEIIK